MGVETLTKTEIDRFLDKALEDETPQGPMDVTRFMILELFISNLFCNSGCTLAWTYVTAINTVKDMKQYNWAKGVLDYMHFGLDQAIKNKKDNKKQPSVSGCLVLILYWLCQRGNLISPIVGRVDMPAAARWSLPELNVMLTHLKNEHIKITIAENEDDNEEKESDTEHNDGGDEEDNEGNQDENEQENQDQLLKQLHKRYKQAVQDQESKLTLNDWCKGKKQNTGKGENDIAQRQLFTSGETVKNDAEQTTSQIHEQKQEKMNEHNMDEDIATNQNEQVQEKHQQQLESQPDSQEKMYQNIFVEMVGSIPEYYKDEMKPTHDRIHELKEAVDYWIDKADDLKYKMQVAIQSCMEKNAFIEKICSEKEAAQERTKKLKKKLEQQEEQNKKLQAQLEEEKLKRRHLQNNYELLEREKMSCIETMKQNDFDIASLALWGLQHS
ncbi:stress response protein NST1-like [Prunus persica]|uniref:stress response protein NST1-like n=1 Tax=Prunus persica TaxID=3760 RepID=UPI0009AB4A3C|nr:stress response protein NST1-like [Prunus persica]